MDIIACQRWIRDFYKERGWYELDPFMRTNFLAEETGEVARAVRAIEIGRDRPDEREGSTEEKMDDSAISSGVGQKKKKIEWANRTD